MKIYYFDKDTGLYRSSGEAQADPAELAIQQRAVIDANPRNEGESEQDYAARLDGLIAAIVPDKWLVPGNATLDAPAQITVFRDGGWVVTSDIRSFT